MILGVKRWRVALVRCFEIVDALHVVEYLQDLP